MAVLPLNSFRTITIPVTKTGQTFIYTCPVGVTAIILLVQIANIGDDTAAVDFYHVHLTTKSLLVKGALIPANDALNPLSGRLVIEEGDSIFVQGQVPEYGSGFQPMQVVVSLVESATS